ncbi:hypothetical protein H4S06_001586, partial [Coemansia sp. BCRC 34490]
AVLAEVPESGNFGKIAKFPGFFAAFFAVGGLAPWEKPLGLSPNAFLVPSGSATGALAGARGAALAGQVLVHMLVADPLFACAAGSFAGLPERPMVIHSLLVASGAMFRR